MMTKSSKYFSLVLLLSMLLLVFSAALLPALAKGKMGLPETFVRLWNSESDAPKPEHKHYDKKITSLFMKADQEMNVKFTMLIAHSKSITHAIRNILDKDITPIICSVSSLPLESTEFNPTVLQFEQDGRIWSPTAEESAVDMFALGKDGHFGGTLHDSEIHQGVIFLPGWFNVHKPINIIYKGYSKRTYLSYR